MPMLIDVKNLVIKTGRFILDLCNSLFLIFLISFPFLCTFLSAAADSLSENKIPYIYILLLIFVVVSIIFLFWVMANFVIYLATDIADNLRIIAKNTRPVEIESISNNLYIEKNDNEKTFLSKGIYGTNLK
ncbi:MAG: hypothetical protein SFZ03_11630 [Candidatus Melainabacteria bacterium]|nr:hypothetical protein [Candidatus Melainabacteria bacterium]